VTSVDARQVTEEMTVSEVEHVVANISRSNFTRLMIWKVSQSMTASPLSLSNGKSSEYQAIIPPARLATSKPFS
jgi:hypothetical protein